MTTYAEKLLDKAKVSCMPQNYSGVANALGVKRQHVSNWKLGREPIPEDHFRRLARMAHVDEAEWWLLLQADSNKPEQAKRAEALVRRLGIATSFALCAITISKNAYFLGDFEHLTSAVCLLCSAIVAAAITHAAGKVARYASTHHHTANAT